MKTNLIKFTLRSTNVAGWPFVRIKNNDQDFQTINIDSEFTVVDIKIPLLNNHHNCLFIERYGKTADNQQNDNDQIVEIINLTVDGITIPDFILDKFSKFEFDEQVHVGSKYFSPNGVWKFEYQVPLLTWILDQKILHESQYNSDHVYPWSYKFGPDSVGKLEKQLELVYNKVQQIL